MKHKSNNWAIVISSLSLVTILVTFNHCVVQTKVNKKKAVTSTNSNSTTGEISGDFTDIVNPTPEPDPGGDTTESTSEVVNEEVHVGVKNFEEINMTMSVLTGVPYTTNAIKNVYRDISVLLPTTNDIKTFVGANQVSIVKLAGEYCYELVRVSGYRSIIWPNVNFGESSATAFSDAKRDYIIDMMMQKFWNVSADQFYLYNMERNELFLLIDEILMGENSNSTTTQNTIRAVCTAALSSAHTILL